MWRKSKSDIFSNGIRTLVYYFIIWYECRKLKRNMIHERKRRFSPLLLTFLLLKLLRCHFSGRTFCNVNYLPELLTRPSVHKYIPWLKDRCDTWRQHTMRLNPKKLCNMTKFFLFKKTNEENINCGAGWCWKRQRYFLSDCTW